MHTRIKTVRKSVGMSQRAFGESLGASRDIISNIEQGRQAISDTLVRLICQVYNIDEKWLRTGEGQMHITRSTTLDKLANEYNLSSFELQLFRNYLLLSMSERAKILEILDLIHKFRNGVAPYNTIEEENQ